ncbi:1995_t:CDS:2, partial [Acaulospora colombiana]
MLDHLASVKGDNIVVVVDCCHSGSITREAPEGDDDVRFRALPLSKPLLDEIDNDIFKAHCMSGDGPSRRLGTASHVLLAACGASERAYERAGQGDFTRAILETLSKLSRKDLSYRDLIRKLPPLARQ